MPAPLPLPRRVSTFSAFQHRNFRIFFTGHSVSVVGRWMHHIALGWLVLELTNSPFYVGLVSALARLPILLLSLHAGVLVDRVSKRKLIIVTQIISMVLALTMSALTLLGIVTVWHAAFLTMLLGTAITFELPARQSFIIELVGKEDLTNAVALNSSTFNASRVVGPAVAGILLGTVGVGVCFLINGLTYLFSIISLLRVKLSPRDTLKNSRSTWEDLRDGIAFIGSERRVFSIIQLIAVLSVFGFPYEVLLPVLARDVMHRGALEYGWMVSAAGAGALAGALGLATVAGRIPRGKLIRLGAFLFGVSIVALSIVGTVSNALPVLAVIGAAMVLTTASANTLLQTISPDGLRGRVMSVYSLAFLGLGPFGSLMSGWVAEQYGTQVAIGIGGALVAVLSLIVVGRNKELLRTR